METADTDMSGITSTLYIIGAIVAVVLLIVFGAIFYLSCIRKEEEPELMGATVSGDLEEGFLRREQLEDQFTKDDDDSGEWQCVVCAYSNPDFRRACLMCGTPQGFLESQSFATSSARGGAIELLRKTSLENTLTTINGISGSGTSGSTSDLENDLKARQRALFKRRLNAMEAKKNLTQRQRGAFRRRLWERKKLPDGKFHWTRQSSSSDATGAKQAPMHDKAKLKTLSMTTSFGSSSSNLLNRTNSNGGFFGSSRNINSDAAGTNNRGLDSFTSGSGSGNFDRMISTGFVCQFDTAVGNLDWRKATDVSIDMDSFNNLQQILDHEDDAVDFEGVMAMDFRMKKQWFLVHLSKLATPVVDGVTKAMVRRERILDDSVKALTNLAPSDLKTYLKITFDGEPGIDAGGLLREWFGLVCTELFSEKRKFFVATKGEDMSYWINPLSEEVTKDHLQYFRFAGVLIGKAIFEGVALDVHLALPLLKYVVGIPISFTDLEFLDQDLHKNCQWLRANKDVDALCLTFSTLLENGTEVDLIPDGRNVDVTDANKEEYLKLLLQYRLFTSISDQLTAFLGGFYDVIPRALVSVFDYQELELLLCGIPSIDMVDWKKYTIVRHLKGGPPADVQERVIEWFWNVLESLTVEEKARLLQFTTGTSRLPVEGFKGLMSSSGFIHHFTIQLVDYANNPSALLPKAHTCFNRLDLPLYKSQEELENYLSMVIQMEIVGFGLE